MNKYLLGIVLVLFPYLVNLCLKLDRDAAISRMQLALEQNSRQFWTEDKCHFKNILIHSCREQLLIGSWKNQLIAVDFSFSTDLDWDKLIADHGPYLHFLYTKFMKLEFVRQMKPGLQARFLDYEKIELADFWLKTQIAQINDISKNNFHPLIFIPSSFKWSAREQHYNQLRFYAQAKGLFVPSFYKWLGYLRFPWQEKNLERVLEISQKEMEDGFIYQLPTVLKEIHAWGDLNNQIVTPERTWHIQAKVVSRPSGIQFAGSLDISGFSQLKIKVNNYNHPFPLTLLAADDKGFACNLTLTKNIIRGPQAIHYDLTKLRDKKGCDIRRLSFFWDKPIRNLNFKIEEVRWEK